ncbi:MAG TPA: tRNA (adenosine(37)-N6)-threonylcarbamoyltransferase complex dimerization subunit type 1 TsaB [Bacillota bacterium]|nr:tRNA (adenosine(37)-N6)-threonylcarbamoyltransferase complex dimerization subunit type 1 TsaB [Bacillota bacterium]
MNLLAINTSDQVLGVALLKNGQIIGQYTTNLRKGHATRLMPAIVDLMEEVNWTPQDLEKIVVAKGPGSYTGVRIGLTTAKTLAWALKLPIEGVSSIRALAYQAIFSPYLISPFFDARRERIYTGLFKSSDGHLVHVKDEQNIAMSKWLEKLVALNEKILFLSPSISLYKEMIEEALGRNALFASESYNIIQPAHLALASIPENETNVHTLIPNYLRLAEAEAKWREQKGANE